MVPTTLLLFVASEFEFVEVEVEVEESRGGEDASSPLHEELHSEENEPVGLHQFCGSY